MCRTDTDRHNFERQKMDDLLNSPMLLHTVESDNIHLLLDIDECAQESGTALCSQICLNEVGSHSCDCYPGYELASNNFTCNGMEYSALWADSAQK